MIEKTSSPRSSPDDCALEVRFGIVRGISYGLFRKPDPFVAQARALGANLIRVYFYWSQIEPEPDQYSFEVVDTLLGELDGPERAWVTVCSSSPWATRQATTFLPPSPAKDPERYRRFVHRLVSHCAGRVQYWQCDNEPSNVGLTWAGTAEEYVAQLRVMHQAVKVVDPAALVVLGGATYGLPASPPDSPERQFFDVLLRDGRDAFDLFDLHLYASADRIAADIEAVRALMRSQGYEKPVVASEYGAPTPELFPEALAPIHQAMTAAFASAAGGGGKEAGGEPQQTPERVATTALYARMADLPPQLQMFMAGCSPELEAKRHRISCREIVARNLLALSAGVRVTACWKLAPEVSGYEDHLSLMELFYGKLRLMDYEGTTIARRLPAGGTLALLTERLRGVERVTRVDVPDRPGVFLFLVQRRDRGPLLVVWNRADPFSGEDDPPVRFVWPWAGRRATAVDALGGRPRVELANGHVSLPISVTPVFVATD